jgi:hypothetical protein
MSTPVLTISVAVKDPAEADRYAAELRQAILDHVPPGTRVSRVRGDPEDMQFGETIVVDMAAAVIVHGVIEGIKLFQELRKVRVGINAGGNPIQIDRVSPDLAATITKHLSPPSNQG